MKKNILYSLIEGKLYSEAQTLGKLYIEENNLNQDQKRILSDIVMRAYAFDGKLEEGAAIYEQFHFSNNNQED